MRCPPDAVNIDYSPQYSQQTPRSLSDKNWERLTGDPRMSMLNYRKNQCRSDKTVILNAMTGTDAGRNNSAAGDFSFQTCLFSLLYTSCWRHRILIPPRSWPRHQHVPRWSAVTTNSTTCNLLVPRRCSSNYNTVKSLIEVSPRP